MSLHAALSKAVRPQVRYMLRGGKPQPVQLRPPFEMPSPEKAREIAGKTTLPHSLKLRHYFGEYAGNGLTARAPALRPQEQSTLPLARPSLSELVDQAMARGHHTTGTTSYPLSAGRGNRIITPQGVVGRSVPVSQSRRFTTWGDNAEEQARHYKADNLVNPKQSIGSWAYDNAGRMANVALGGSGAAFGGALYTAYKNRPGAPVELPPEPVDPLPVLKSRKRPPSTEGPADGARLLGTPMLRMLGY